MFLLGSQHARKNSIPALLSQMKGINSCNLLIIQMTVLKNISSCMFIYSSVEYPVSAALVIQNLLVQKIAALFSVINRYI